MPWEESERIPIGNVPQAYFDFTSDALTEIGGLFERSGKVIVPLTVRATPRGAENTLDEQIAMKLA